MFQIKKNYFLICLYIIIIVIFNYYEDDSIIIHNNDGVNVSKQYKDNQIIVIHYFTTQKIDINNTTNIQQPIYDKKVVLFQGKSFNNLFDVKLYLNEKIDINETDEYLLNCSVSLDNQKDYFFLKFKNNLLEFSNKLFLDISYKNKVFTSNLYILSNLQAQFEYLLDLVLLDDYINFHLLEIKNKNKKVEFEKIELNTSDFILINQELKNGNLKFTDNNTNE